MLASVNKNDEILGYISYYINWNTSSVDGFTIMAFSNNNIEFARDVHLAFCDCFYKYNLNRISFIVCADNPFVKSCRNFARNHGGKECGYYRDAIKLLDNKLHDIVCFEYLSKEFSYDNYDLLKKKSIVET